MSVRISNTFKTLAVGAFALSASSALAENGPGVTDDSVLICSYQPMTGSVSSYFRMGRGADAWINHVNENGGINGRMIEFRMVDDQYEPARTMGAVRRFVERDECFAIVAPLGSAPTVAVIEYVVENEVPLIGPGTGADVIVDHESKWVFPLYPSYFIEGEQLVRFSKEVFGASTVAILYQNDPAGQTHLEGVKASLEEHGVELVSEQSYMPREIDLSSQVISMQRSGADAVICSCAPEPAARFYTERAKLSWDVPVVNVFFGKSPTVPELAGPAAIEGIYFATIFRDFDSPAEQIQEAKAILEKYYPTEQPDAIHLWGFAAAQVFTEAFDRMGDGPFTRERLVETLEGFDNWTGSVVPSVSMSEGGGPEHLIVRDMSFVKYTDGRFEDFVPPWMAN